jgi:hypothetical protein
MNPPLSFKKAVEMFGPIVNGQWAKEAEWCEVVNVPEAISDAVINSLTGQPWTHVYCNRYMAPALQRVFAELVAEDLAVCLSTFDGCYERRSIRGLPGRVSTHAYALALDFDALKNPLGAMPVMDRRVVSVFDRNGFIYGGNFPRRDGMHMQYALW